MTIRNLINPLSESDSDAGTPCVGPAAQKHQHQEIPFAKDYDTYLS